MGGGSVGAASTPGPQGVSGSWFRATHPLPPGPMRACLNGAPLELTQSGSSVTGSEQSCSGPCSPPVALAGEDQNGRVTLRALPNATEVGGFEAKPVAYELHYDATADRLVGTRNGEPFVAARFVKDTDPRCDRLIR